MQSKKVKYSSKCKKMGHYPQEFWSKDVKEIVKEEKNMQNVDIHQ